MHQQEAEGSRFSCPVPAYGSGHNAIIVDPFLESKQI